MMQKIHSFIQKFDKVFLLIGYFLTIVHIARFQSITTHILLLFLGYWLIIGFLVKLDERYFFGLALFFLVCSGIFLLLGNPTLSEKCSVWEFSFLLLGIWQWLVFDVFVSLKKHSK